MFVFLLIICVVIPTKSIEQVDNPCLTDYRMESIENIGVFGEYGKYSSITKDCNSGVEDQEQIYSVSSKSRCWINSGNFTQIVSGHKINRCGVCLALHGPSMETYYCAIVGAFTTNVTETIDKERTSKLLFVDDQLYRLISGYSGSKHLTFPVNFNLVYCPYSVYPAAIITNITRPNKYTQPYVAVNIINTNLIISKIIFNNVTYRADLDTCLYYIPVSANGFLKIFNLVGCSSIINFRFNTYQMQVAHSPLPSALVENNDCDFRVDLNIAGDVTTDDELFKWIIRYSNDTNLTNGIVLPNEDAEFDISPLSVGIISFSYPTPLIASKLFGYFYFEVEVSHELSLPQPIVMTLYGDNFSDATMFSFSKSIVLNYVDTNLINGYIQRKANISVRIAGSYGYCLLFRSSYCYLIYNIYVAANVWMLRYHNTKNSTQHWVVRRMLMTDATERTYYQCNSTKYQCTEEDECNPTDSIYPPNDGEEIKYYDVGCVPYCGICRTGSFSVIPFILLNVFLLLIM
ncbi:Uncharacterized protein QTN25_010479 [Entamoeba marina]